MVSALVIVGLLALLCISMIWDERRLLRLTAERKDDSICSFVRALDYRHLDTGTIRAVYEELQQYLRIPVPLRPADRIQEDLRFDAEDLDDLAEQIAKRCGRSWENIPDNPYYGNVKTVADLIGFLNAQPNIRRQ